MWIIQYRKFFYILSLFITGISLLAIAVYGLKLGIDFKGGTLYEIEYQGERPSIEELRRNLDPVGIGEYTARATGERGYIVRTHEISQTQKNVMAETLSFNGTRPFEEKRFTSIGPALGKEAQDKSALSILLVIIGIVLFIAFAFRAVSEPVSSWKYGLVAILALVHDVVVPTGVFAVLGHFAGVEIDTLFVTALLVILGFSIHDTIVVFDRVRENLRINKEKRATESFTEVVGRSVSQTFARSINTSLTTLLALIALYFLGDESTRNFSLALLIGITVGTYSSIFLASPLLVTLEKLQKKK